MGRPPVLTPATAHELCGRIATGRTLAGVCRDDDMPAPSTVYSAVAASAEFAEAIARAREESAHGLAMSAVEIADEALKPDGKYAGVQPQLIRNACDQRRWLAGKYNAMYSDRVAVMDADGGSIAARLAQMSAEQRALWAAELAARARRLLEAPTIDHDGGE
jgi:hypothetical protein